MSQRDILEVLLENNGWLTATQIEELTKDCNRKSINDSLKRLIKGKFVKSRKCEDLKHGYEYKKE